MKKKTEFSLEKHCCGVPPRTLHRKTVGCPHAPSDSTTHSFLRRSFRKLVSQSHRQPTSHRLDDTHRSPTIPTAEQLCSYSRFCVRILNAAVRGTCTPRFHRFVQADTLYVIILANTNGGNRWRRYNFFLGGGGGGVT